MEKHLKVRVLIPGGMPDAFWYGAGTIPSDNLIPGAVVEAPFHKKRMAGVVLESGTPDLPFETRDIEKVSDFRLPPMWMEMIRWISQYYFTPLPQVLQTCLPKHAVKALFSPPRPIKNPTKARRAPAGQEPQPDLRLTGEQENALAAVFPSVRKGLFQTFLLHGITGSGKTLVYLHLAKLAIEMGKNVLVLLPEIALTPQTLARFQGFLSHKIHPLHSNLSAAERRELWKAIFAGTARVIVGARSAVLSPISNLGLIVVDEEHDSSYKQTESSPRYNARDLALFRGRQEGCPVVLGSATPSLESYFSALGNKYSLVTLKRRATGTSPPKVVMVDMRRQYALQGDQALSIPLREALQACLEKNEQAILFLNRRGYSQRRLCGKCGAPQQCPNCVIPLVYHKSSRSLKCHYCEHSSGLPSLCRQCGSADFLDVGRGIEKVEEHLQNIFPHANVLRLDRDTTTRIGSAEDILGRFKRGESSILLGTQMVAKGHDFPRVNLVGVIDADTGLGLSDFRAQERSFQLITQVAGRAGRHEDTGTVYLQTFRPSNPVLGFALNHDFESFYNFEIPQREDLLYPPYRRLLLMEISGQDESHVNAQMKEFGRIFARFAAQVDAPVLGPGFAVIKKINGNFRTQMVAKGKAFNQLQWAMLRALDEFQPGKRRGIKMRIDMDPVAML